MFERGNKEFLIDIRESVIRTIYYTEKMSYDEFRKDIKTQDAVIHNLAIIGEASKDISEDLKKKYSQVSWESLAGVKDKLTHHYFGLNFDIVWNIVRQDMPVLLFHIEEITESEYL